MPPDAGSNHFARGCVLYQEKRYELAASEFELAAVADVNNPKPLVLLAEALIGLGDFDAAEEAARGSLVRAADFSFGHVALARALLGQQRLSEAETVAHEALRLAPKSEDCRLLLADVAKERWDWPDMLAHASEALEINPTDVRALFWQALAMVQLERLDEAIPLLRDVLVLSPEDARVHYTLGRALLKAGRVGEALPCLREAVRLAPNSKSNRLLFIEALRSRNPVYLAFADAAIYSPLVGITQGRILNTLFLGYLALVAVASGVRLESLPLLAGLFGPILAAFAWPRFRAAVFDVVLQFDPIARPFLSRRMKFTAWIVTAMLVLAAGGFLFAIIEPAILIAAIPLATTTPWLLFISFAEEQTASIRRICLWTRVPCALSSTLGCLGAASAIAGGPDHHAVFAIVLLMISAGLFLLSLKLIPSLSAI